MFRTFPDLAQAIRRREELGFYLKDRESVFGGYSQGGANSYKSISVDSVYREIILPLDADRWEAGKLDCLGPYEGDDQSRVISCVTRATSSNHRWLPGQGPNAVNAFYEDWRADYSGVLENILMTSVEESNMSEENKLRFLWHHRIGHYLRYLVSVNFAVEITEFGTLRGEMKFPQFGLSFAAAAQAWRGIYCCNAVMGNVLRGNGHEVEGHYLLSEAFKPPLFKLITVQFSVYLLEPVGGKNPTVQQVYDNDHRTIFSILPKALA